jgi:hypothetical protein
MSSTEYRSCLLTDAIKYTLITAFKAAALFNIIKLNIKVFLTF